MQLNMFSKFRDWFARLKHPKEHSFFSVESILENNPQAPYFDSLHGEKIYVARDVAHAVAMVEEFRQQGLYDTFRGQCCASWAVVPSQVRPGVNRDDALRRLMGFVEWLDQKRGIKKLGLRMDQCLAIAQHYGIPTMLIDFTASPRIAGFFATDGASRQGCAHGVIYMINSGELAAVVEMIRANNKEFQLEIVKVDVDNLWRLSAQQGVFLFSNAQNFQYFFSLDKIVFAHDHQLPPIMSQNEIYPLDKSPLELDIEHYFFFDKQPGERELKKMLINTFGLPQEVVDDSFAQAENQLLQRRKEEGIKRLFGGVVEPHGSWAGFSDSMPPRIEWAFGTKKLILKLDLDIDVNDSVRRGEMEGRIELVRGSLFSVELGELPNALLKHKKNLRKLLQSYFESVHWLNVKSCVVLDGVFYIALL